jgi:O-antigen/teichoic acid export membrane protein
VTDKDKTPHSLSASEVRGRAVTGVTSLARREIAIRALGLVGNVVLARLLTPKDFGAVAFGYTLIAFGNFLSDGGIAAQLVQRAEEPTTIELRSLLGFILCATVAAVVVIAAVSLPFGRPGTIATVMALSLPLAALTTPTAVVAERQLLYRPFVLSDIIQTVTYNIAAVGLVVLGLGVWGLAVAVIISTAFGTIALLRVGPVGLMAPRFSLGTVRPFLRFGLQFQAVAVLTAFRDQGMNLVSAAIGGLSVLGIWTVANRVLQAILLVFNSLWRVSFPALSRLIESGEDPRPSIQRALALTTTFTGFFVVGIAGTAPALVPVVFGAKWGHVIPVLPWAAAALMIAGPISTAAVGWFYARNEAQVVVVAVTAHTVTWFAVTVPLIPQFGAEGIAMGLLAGAAVDAAVLGHALSKLGLQVMSHCGLPVLAALAAGSVGWIVADAITPAIIALAASLVTVEALYLLVMLAARRAVLLDLYRLLRRSVRQRSRI